MQPQKIFEIKGSDWMKGLSIQSGLALGGLFQSANTFDPFEYMGYLYPSLSPVIVDASTITTRVDYLHSYSDASVGHVFALGNRTGTGGKFFYDINMSTFAVTDYSGTLDRNALTGDYANSGLTVYKNYIIYHAVPNDSIRSNTLVPTAGNDTHILSDALANITGYPCVFREGSDGVLYYTATGNASIGKIVLTTGTSGNTNAAFQMTDTSMIPKDICNDGIYTIFIADNNTGKVTTATSRCRIFFWDTIKSKADIIYDIPDSYLISCRYVDGKVIVLGASGIWVCNSVTSPKLVFPLIASQLPANAYGVSTKNNIMYWASVGVGEHIYAYGSKIGKPILFTPYQSSQIGKVHTALVSSGDYFVSATNNPNVYLLNSGTTRGSTAILTSTTQLPQPYTLSYIKVTLKQPLTTGQEVSVYLSNGNGQNISSTITKTYTALGAKQTLVFEPKLTSIKQFEDFILSVNPAYGAIVERVAIYGIPIEDNSQTI